MKGLILKPGQYVGQLRMTKEEKEVIFSGGLIIPQEITERDSQKNVEDITGFDDYIIEEERERESRKKLKNKHLIELANLIVDWCKEFANTINGKLCFNICGHVLLFRENKYSLSGYVDLVISIYLGVFADSISTEINNLELFVEINSFGKNKEIMRTEISSYYKEVPIEDIVRNLHVKTIENFAKIIKNGNVHKFIKDPLNCFA